MNLKLKQFFILFMMLYPIFDMVWFYNSYTTLIRILIIFTMFVLLLMFNKESRKNIKWLIIYCCIVFVYFIFHHNNALIFKSNVPGNFDYSIIKEFLQIIKLITPVFLLYILNYLKIEKCEYLKVIKCWIYIICGTIIISNLLEFSLGSYSGSKILGNIFDWFNTDLTYYDLASKGFFMYANQIGAFLILLLPITFYFYIKKQLSIYYIIGIMITLLMIGTRVANIGGVLVLFTLVTIYLIFVFLKKEKWNMNSFVTLLILIICYSLMLPFSPTISRDKIYDYILKDNLEFVSLNASIDKKIYIENNYKELKITDEFILKSYPYQYDVDFWYDILQLPESLRTNYRYLEIEMVKRVVEINNNNLDKWFGITNTRIQNIFHIERDYVLQYYAYGIFGLVLFLGIYFIICIQNIQYFIKNITLESICVLASTVLLLAIAYLSGNILNQLTLIIPFIFVVNQCKYCKINGK